MDIKALLDELKGKLDPEEKLECTIYGSCSGLVERTGLISITNKRIIFYDGSIKAKEFCELYNARRSLFTRRMILDFFGGSIVIQNIATGDASKFATLLWTKIPKGANPDRSRAIEQAIGELEERRMKGLINDMGYTMERKRITEAAVHPPKLGPKFWKGFKIAWIAYAVLMASLLIYAASLPSPASQPMSEEKLAYYAARTFVEQRLKAPKTAEFGTYYDSNTVITKMDDNNYKIRLYVDSENSFGAMIRSEFIVDVRKADNGDWVLMDIKELE